MHTKMKPEEGRRFGIRLRNCPKSLKQIVQAYRQVLDYSFSLLSHCRVFRLVALSFSGLEFDESEDNGKDGKADKPRKGGHLKEATLEAGQNAISLKSLFFIILNLGLMATYVVPFIYVELENFNTKENETEQQNYRGGISNNGTGILTVKDYLALRQFNAEFAHFKPILRNVMSMVLYVFIVEGFVNFAINGYTGGKLICCLAQVPNIQKLDTSKSFAVRRIGVILVSIVVIHAAGIALFNQKEIRTLRKLFFSKDFVLEANAKLDLLQLLCFSLMHILHYLILSMMPLLFLYTTTIFTKHLDAMSESIQTGKCKIKPRSLH